MAGSSPGAEVEAPRENGRWRASVGLSELDTLGARFQIERAPQENQDFVPRTHWEPLRPPNRVGIN